MSTKIVPVDLQNSSQSGQLQLLPLLVLLHAIVGLVILEPNRSGSPSVWSNVTLTPLHGPSHITLKSFVSSFAAKGSWNVSVTEKYIISP